MKYIANTNEQDLSEHLMAVSLLSGLIYSELFGEGMGKKLAMISGLFHDVGKVDASFQKYLNNKVRKGSADDSKHAGEDNKKSFEEIIRHNEFSWAALYDLSFNDDIFCDEIVKYAVLWHHAEKYRKNSIRLNDIQCDKTYKDVLYNMSKLINSLGNFSKNEIGVKLKCDFPKTFEEKYNPLLAYRHIKTDIGKTKYEYDYKNSINKTQVRLAVVVADRIVSKLSKDELDRVYNDKEALYNILPCSEGLRKLDISKALSKRFDLKSKRSRMQLEAAKSCSKISNDLKTCILQGPAGVGKTMVSLEWHELSGESKLIYICPRVDICKSLYEDIRKEYLPHLHVQLFTGQYKYNSINKIEEEIEDSQFMKSDIVITTIDQISSIFTNHSKFSLLYDLLRSNVIIDEYHEIKQTPPIFVFLKEFLMIRKRAGAYTLLMSATPDPLLTESLLDSSNINKHMKKMNAFHDKKFTVNLKEYTIPKDKNTKEHPFWRLSPDKDSFVISNRILDAQMGCVLTDLPKNGNAFAVHSNYTKRDRERVMKLVYDNFGKKRVATDFDYIRTGPVLQASFNISAKNVITEVSSPEDILQRLGRCNRFGEFDAGVFSVYYPSDLKPSRYLKDINFSRRSSSGFIEFLKYKMGKKFEITLDQIYALYFEFHKSYKGKCEKDFNEFEQKAYENLYNHDSYKPIDFFIKKNKKKDEYKIPASTIRGSSVYVLPTNTNYVDGVFIEDGWLYDPKNIKNKNDLLTMSEDDHKLTSVMKEFVSRADRFNSMYGTEKLYNKHNKTKGLIFRNAKSPEMPIFIGNVSNRSQRVDVEFDPDMTYVYTKRRDGVCALGLIDKEIISQ